MSDLPNALCFGRKKLEKFLGSDLKKTCELVASRGDFETGHLIGGNRLKKNKTIKFKADVKWNISQSRMKQFLIYICTVPIMVLKLYTVFQKD